MNKLTCPLALTLRWSTRLMVIVDPSLPVARTLIASCETLLLLLRLTPNHTAKWPEYVTVPVSGARVNHASCVFVIHTSPAALTVMWNTALPVPLIVPAGAPQVESTWNGGNAPWKFCVDEVGPSTAKFFTWWCRPEDLNLHARCTRADCTVRRHAFERRACQRLWRIVHCDGRVLTAKVRCGLLWQRDGPYPAAQRMRCPRSLVRSARRAGGRRLGRARRQKRRRP